jgi:hypothetical protein
LNAQQKGNKKKVLTEGHGDHKDFLHLIGCREKGHRVNTERGNSLFSLQNFAAFCSHFPFASFCCVVSGLARQPLRSVALSKMKTISFRDLRQKWPEAERALKVESEVVITDAEPVARLTLYGHIA